MNGNRLKVESIPLRGGTLCLDFTNTVEWRGGEDPLELLPDYPALVAWGRRVQLISDSQLAILMNRAKKEMELAEAVLKRSVALREALFRLFSNIARNKIPPARDLDLLVTNWHSSRGNFLFLNTTGSTVAELHPLIRFDFQAAHPCRGNINLPIHI